MTNSTIDAAKTYWLDVKNTTIRSTFGSGGTAIKAVDVGHFWLRENSVIDNYGTGIDASTGLNWNIIMTDGSTIQQCVTGIKLNGSLFNNTVELGILHMDCARMIQNWTAIRGRDIIFSAYQRPPNFNTFTKNPYYPNERYIESVFQRRVETDLWFHGNFWDNTTPPSTPVNAAWSFLSQTIPQPLGIPWVGTFHLDNTRTGDPQNATNTTCGGIELRGGEKDPFSQNTVVTVNGVLRDVRVQYEAGFKKIKEKKLKNALELLLPLAELPQTTRSAANSTVKHFVDIARAMTLKTGGVTTRSSNGGWIPESLVETPREVADNQLVISPNPANTAVQLELKKGDYTLHVLNTVGQTILAQNTEGSLSVDIATWTNGIYLFELIDKATNQRQRSKVVVQH